MKNIFVPLLILLVGLTVGCLVVSLPVENSFVAAIRNAENATVIVMRYWKGGEGFCSGTIVGKNKSEYTVLTAGHCVGDFENVPLPVDPDKGLVFDFGFHPKKRFVMNQGPYYISSDDSSDLWKEEAFLMSVGNVDAGFDFAMLVFQHSAILTVAPIHVQRLAVNDNVFSVGFPYGIPKVPLFGKVVRVGVSLPFWKNVDLLQMVGVKSGSSGSAVFDSRGRIRAIVVGRDPDNSGVVSVLPLEMIADVL